MRPIDVRVVDPYEEIALRHWSMRIVARVGRFGALLGVAALFVPACIVLTAIVLGIVVALLGFIGVPVVLG